MRDAYLMDLDTLEKFFQRCLDEEAVTEHERMSILKQLIEEKRAAYIGSTTKSAPELATELIK